MKQEDTTIRVIRPESAGQRECPSVGALIIGYGLRFFMLFATWVILSGMFDLFHLTLGVVCSIFVVATTADFFPPEMCRFHRLGTAFRFAAYFPWLVLQIIKANIAMLRLVFHPRLNELISPRIVSFKTDLRSKLALTALANSITLTPGTITVAIDERGYVAVHAIDDASAEGLPGDMQRKLKAVFEEC